MGPFHQNSKLSDHTEELIIKHFNVDFGYSETDNPVNEEVQHEPIEEQQEEAVKEDVDLKAESVVQQELDPDLPAINMSSADTMNDNQQEDQPEEHAIDSEKLLEMLETEEEVDLSEFTKIKAPKKELKGLKVVGKIDLPEPKPKIVEKPKDKENEPVDESTVVTEQDIRRSRRKPRPERKPLTPEEKEKRRLRAKRKKEEYEARKKKREAAAVARREKERKKARYEKQLKENTSQKPKAHTISTKIENEEVNQEPVITDKAQIKKRNIFERLWRWFWYGE